MLESLCRAFRPATLLKKRFQHKCYPENIVKFLKKAFYRAPLVAASNRCFPANFAKFLRIYFFIEHLRWLFLSCRFKSGLNRVISGLIAYQVVNSIDRVIIRWQKGRKHLPSSSKFLVPQKIRFFSGNNVLCVINICNLQNVLKYRT